MNKPKDRYIAAAQVGGLLVAYPFAACFHFGRGCVEAATETLSDIRYGWRAGVVKSIKDAHADMLDHAAGKRRRRERDRQRVTASDL